MSEPDLETRIERLGHPRVLIVGDLILGVGHTTWVGGYSRCVADYLASLDRVERLEPRLLLPAHGGPIGDPLERIERYRDHRLGRIGQVERALDAWPDATPEQLFLIVYGTSVPEGLRPAARASLSALIEHALGGAR